VRLSAGCRNCRAGGRVYALKGSAGIVYQVYIVTAVYARSGAFWGVLLLNGPRLIVRGRRSFQIMAAVKGDDDSTEGGGVR
jgi:hypothetical protein